MISQQTFIGRAWQITEAVHQATTDQENYMKEHGPFRIVHLAESIVYSNQVYSPGFVFIRTCVFEKLST